jgi:glycosyltransferase involved in cell wall biosynthesis
LSRRLRVLLSAYACEPGRGSEPGVGWNQARQAARFHEVWILTRGNNRPAIERELMRNPLPHAHWIYFDLPRWLRFWKKGQRGIHLYYYLWQLAAFRLARRLHQEVRFDLVHHVTFVNYWTPSLLVFLPVPFIWGPVGGGESAPGFLWGTFSARGKAFELMRAAARWRGESDPLVRLTARRARLALATTLETARRLERLGCGDVRLMGESALEQHALAGPADRRPAGRRSAAGRPLRLLSVGRLVHLKGYHLSLAAFARIRKKLPRASYWLIGDGPERKRLMKLSERLGLGASVRFLGDLPRQRVLRILASGDLLVHPSLHDSGGWACLEAMIAGCPVVCFDLGGPAVQVSAECGIKVPVTGREQAVEGLRTALERLGADARLRRSMGAVGRRRVRQLFSWERKGELLRELYRQVLDGRHP